MPIYRPSELKKYLEACGAFPKKGLSQNFLVDGNILKNIARLAELEKGDLIIEIGPGPGALTETLLEYGCQVIAIEKDAVLAKGLERLQNNDTSLTILCNDALEVSFDDIIGERKAKIVANIPYHLTTPIFQKIMRSSSKISLCVLMVQEEVAKRCIAKPDSPQYGILSLLLSYYGEVRYGFFVSPKCFYPEPKVGSSIIRFDIQKKCTVTDEEEFFNVIKEAFCHRRKMLKVSLKAFFESNVIEKSLLLLGKAPTARPEELSLDEWVRLFTSLKE